ncbi:type II toxin-antitoxin system YhaV family toxin [Methylobacterium sp. J-030]|uniref:type II toxin-antitoxin system YhaV family toxin n=1 Tax=Methylobacterium sp. J-030 TaxID=2836627 RepID=UPI001FB92B84|nr:type II toxin-antitoxin system YhaV family toxin [Methylobacterium sp. J-030]MCJ2069905.1 type II toxin-antitoxin system YhaV family toxin [Methylobacterium sp. J-030]
MFLDQLEDLIATVMAARTKDPGGYPNRRVTQVLAAVLKVAFEVIPEDPTRAQDRQGDTLGSVHRRSFRARFLQRYRPFFRYREAGGRRVIVLAWVNDDRTLRAYGSRSDAYAVFQTMLRQGNPPDDWDARLHATDAESERLRQIRCLGDPD